ncbi:MAG: 30S ribosomal protein S9 [Bacteroidetes bacterium GWA2_31_9]|nr:MAG: 30S ribosomal protein S9 [Bacteroidetes bacterium GWA2_31_9]
MELVNAIGRRKEAVARVYLTEGTGKVTINHKDINEYFPIDILRVVVLQPLTSLNLVNNYDINANLDGGGFKGQAEALRLGITRAIIKLFPEHKSALRAQGFVTRDPRVVERKKPGRPGARKRFQFSKR